MSGGTNGYYGQVYPEFWTGPTGRAIRAAGRDAQVLALYLISNRYATMLGLYRLLLEDIVTETGIKVPALVRAFGQLQALDFAYFDAVTEHVWVREMAKYRLGLHKKSPLDADDNRAKGVRALYARLELNPFLELFFKRYATSLRLKDKRSSGRSKPTPLSLAPSKGLRDPYKALEGAPKGLVSPLQGPCKPVQKQYQYQDRTSTFKLRSSGTGTCTSRSTDACASEHAHPVENSDTPGGPDGTTPGRVAPAVRHRVGATLVRPARRLVRVGGTDQMPARAVGPGLPGPAAATHSGDGGRASRLRETLGTATDRAAAPVPGATGEGEPRSAVGALQTPVDGLRFGSVDGDDPLELQRMRATLRRVIAAERAGGSG